jgi:hypothetical protein
MKKGEIRMRNIIIAAAVLCLTAGAGLAEVAVVPKPGVDPRSAVVQPTKQSAHETAITDCEQMWDRGAHMNKRDWSQTCRRVQNRLRQLELR